MTKFCPSQGPGSLTTWKHLAVPTYVQPCVQASTIGPSSPGWLNSLPSVSENGIPMHDDKKLNVKFHCFWSDFLGSTTQYDCFDEQVKNPIQEIRFDLYWKK